MVLGVTPGDSNTSSVSPAAPSNSLPVGNTSAMLPVCNLLVYFTGILCHLVLAVMDSTIVLIYHLKLVKTCH